MKKLLLSVAILVGATLILSQDNSGELNNVSNDDVVSVQVNLPSNLKN
ncbi:hypothetical protein [Winogradskyella sp. PC D3.3]